MKKNNDKLDKNGRAFYKGNGSVSYHPNGSIQLQLYLREDNGKRKRKAFVSPALDECYRRANDYAADCMGLIVRNGSTIPDILRAKSESDLAMNYIRPQTHAGNLQTARSIEHHIIGQLPITALTKEIIEDYLEHLTEYADNTIDIYFRAVSSAFDIAVQEIAVTKNPMRSYDIKKPKSKKARKPIKALTEEEQARVLADIESFESPYNCISYTKQFLIQLYAGLRMGEVNALTPSDIDFANRVIHVRNTVVTYSNQTLLGDTAKTYAGVRDVPISGKLVPVLEAALEEMPDNPYNLIFYDHKKSKIISTGRASSAFTNLCKRCGIEPRGSHALRHTFATRCIEAGVPAVVLKKWLGHTDIHVTLDTYADVFDRMNNNAIDKLDKHISSIQEV